MILVQNIGNLCRECTRNRQLHIGRALCHWSCGISSLNQITFIFEIVTFILYKSVIHDFGPKKCNLCRQCSRNRQLHIRRAWCHWSRGISSLNQITFLFKIVTFIRAKARFVILVQKYVTFAESVLETGNSTLGEHGGVGVVLYPH